MPVNHILNPLTGKTYCGRIAHSVQFRYKLGALILAETRNAHGYRNRCIRCDKKQYKTIRDNRLLRGQINHIRWKIRNTLKYSNHKVRLVLKGGKLKPEIVEK